MEREKLLCVDLAAGNVEKEINLTVTDRDDSPLYTITAGCTQGSLTLICC